ncbi:MAG TPA: GAF domain-containing protein [Pyrinomonadaceae bacterium]|nr:GAF domain-containing protein [Pyrinomonadaceae bacterium]
MPLTEIYPAERDERAEETGERLSASVRQLEALTALAAAPHDGRESQSLFKGLADSITRVTDYRSCVVLLFTEEAPHRPHVLSHSSNIPAEYVSVISRSSLPREEVAALIRDGIRIEVRGLGFAAYYPPSRYHLLDRIFPDRFKADLERRPPAGEGDEPWRVGDELFVPLMTNEGQFVGLISLDDPRDGRAPDRQSILPVVAFARQTAQLIARRRDAERLSEQAGREALVNRISRAVRQSLDTGEVFRTAVTELGSHLAVDRCTLFMIDAEAGVVRNVAEYNAPGVSPAERVHKMPLVEGLVEAVRRHGVLAFEDTEHDPAIRQIYENILSKLGTRSIMYVGIRVGDDEHIAAAFAISTVREKRRWRDSDLALARAVADQTGIALRQAELYQRAEATSTREALINRLSHAIRASLNLPEISRTATHELGRALHASRVYIRPYEPTGAVVEYEYLAPGSPSMHGSVISYDNPVGQSLMKRPRTVVVHDAETYDEDTPEFNERLREFSAKNGTLSKILCPLVVQGRFRGTLCIHQTDRARHWAKDEVALVEAVAAQLATGLAQAELFEMVERAKRTWEVTFDAMSDGIFIFDNDRRLLRVNRAGAEMESVAPRELLGRRCCEILRAGRGEGCIIERASAEGRSITLEYTPQQLGVPLLVTAEPIRDTSGQIGTVCTVRDLTELRRIEAVARERQSLLENVLESAREVICAVDLEGRIMWSNSATWALNGYTKDEMIGHSFVELIAEGDRQMALESFRRVLAGEPQTLEVRIVTRAGAVRHVHTDTTPLVIEGRTTGVLSITRDITEQKQERERAAQADKLRALGQLASGVAHDFNNALAAILGRAQLLRRSTRDAEIARNLDIIQTAAEDAAATVRRIRSFAHQSPGEEFTLLEVGALLRDAVEITRTRWENDARARGLRYDVELDDGGCGLYARGNASELREVFVNLIVNAIDAMPGGGRLSIKCRVRGGRVQLHFTDNGAGMTEEVRARIFEPFYTTKGMNGTGLGLFVSYGIVERHLGHITAASAPGHGTTFTIELPSAEPVATSDAGAEPVAAGHSAESLSILVVDDEETVRETLAEMIQSLGHRATVVGGGAAALALLDGAAFDLVFTDLSMPEMDGIEVAREIRRRRAGLPVVIVTGYGKDALRSHGAGDAADAVIGKPFDFEQVEEVLMRFKR